MCMKLKHDIIIYIKRCSSHLRLAVAFLSHSLSMEMRITISLHCLEFMLAPSRAWGGVGGGGCGLFILCMN